MSPTEVWTPNPVFLNNANVKVDKALQRYITLFQDGQFEMFLTDCNIDIYVFQYDEQFCQMTIMPALDIRWNISTDSSTSFWRHTAGSSEWKMVSVNSSESNITFVTFHLRRRSIFDTANIFFPIILFVLHERFMVYISACLCFCP